MQLYGALFKPLEKLVLQLPMDDLSFMDPENFEFLEILSNLLENDAMVSCLEYDTRNLCIATAHQRNQTAEMLEELAKGKGKNTPQELVGKNIATKNGKKKGTSAGKNGKRRIRDLQGDWHEMPDEQSEIDFDQHFTAVLQRFHDVKSRVELLRSAAKILRPFCDLCKESSPKFLSDVHSGRERAMKTFHEKCQTLFDKHEHHR